MALGSVLSGKDNDKREAIFAADWSVLMGLEKIIWKQDYMSADSRGGRLLE